MVYNFHLFFYFFIIKNDYHFRKNIVFRFFFFFNRNNMLFNLFIISFVSLYILKFIKEYKFYFFLIFFLSISYELIEKFSPDRHWNNILQFFLLFDKMWTVNFLFISFWKSSRDKQFIFLRDSTDLFPISLKYM